MDRAALRRYTRWTRNPNGHITADILNSPLPITIDPDLGIVTMADIKLTPDEARLHGVRLIEAAALADGHRAIRDSQA